MDGSGGGRVAAGLLRCVVGLRTAARISLRQGVAASAAGIAPIDGEREEAAWDREGGWLSSLFPFSFPCRWLPSRTISHAVEDPGRGEVGSA